MLRVVGVARERGVLHDVVVGEGQRHRVVVQGAHLVRGVLAKRALQNIGQGREPCAYNPMTRCHLAYELLHERCVV